MEQSEPLVSVLMTSYNSEKFIAEAIESVLTSTYSNFELIIVDDCSKDNSFEVAKNYTIIDERVYVYKNHKNIGDYPNRNVAASYANGKYIKYVDCDDLIYPNCLEVMVAAMERYPTAALGLCRSKTDEILLLSSKEAYSDSNGILEYYGPTGSIMLRSKYVEIGKFKEIITISDWEMWHRMAAKWSVVAFPDNLVIWRDHPENTLKSDSHKIGVIKNYLKAKESIFTSKYCPLEPDESRVALRRFNFNIFKYAVRNSLDKRNVKYLLIFLKYNYKFSLKHLF